MLYWLALLFTTATSIKFIKRQRIAEVSKLLLHPDVFKTLWRSRMSIIAFNFTKISAHRKTPGNLKHQVQSKTAVTEVKEVSLGKQKALSFVFAQEVAYEPGMGTILLEGDVLVLSTDEEAKATIESFQKNKRFAAPLMEKVYNQILQRTGIEALILARDIGLPPPVQLPRITSTPKAAVQEAAAAPAAKAAMPDNKGKKK